MSDRPSNPRVGDLVMVVKWWREGDALPPGWDLLQSFNRERVAKCPDCGKPQPADETPAVTEDAAVEARARSNFNATHGIVENLWELQVGANRQLWIDAARRQLAADKTNEGSK